MKILFLGLMIAAFLIIPVGSQQVFAGVDVDQNPPGFRGNDCSALFQFFSVDDPGLLVNSEGCAAFQTELSDFPLDQRCEDIRVNSEIGTDGIEGLACHMEMPNFIDQFDTKLIRFQVTYTGVEPEIFNVKPKNGEDCEQIGFERSANYFFADFECHPNPDNDRIWLTLQPGTVILDALVDTWSFGKIVGGEFSAIDNTALMLAGLQSSAIWMLPLLAGAVGVGAYYIKTRMNKDN